VTIQTASACESRRARSAISVKVSLTPIREQELGDLIDGVQALDTSLSLTAVSDEGCCVGLAADLHRCEADLDGEDISVAVPPRELESDSHQSGPWRRKEVADVIYVAGAKLIWKQNLHLLADELFRVVAEQGGDTRAR